MSMSMLRRLERLEASERPSMPRIITLIDDHDTDVEADMAHYRRDIGADVSFIVFAIVDPPDRRKPQ